MVISTKHLQHLCPATPVLGHGTSPASPALCLQLWPHTIRSINVPMRQLRVVNCCQLKCVKHQEKGAVRRKLHVALPARKLHMLQIILLLCCGAVGQQQLSPSGDLAAAVDASQEILIPPETVQPKQLHLLFHQPLP